MNRPMPDATIQPVIRIGGDADRRADAWVHWRLISDKAALEVVRTAQRALEDATQVLDDAAR